jgi:stress-induced morphogen
MNAKLKNKDKDVQKILEMLRREYKPHHPKAAIEAYRYKNLFSIRIRVVDPDFAGMSIAQREKLIWAILDALPEDIRADISMVLLLTPKEKRDSLLDLEFEQPSETML